MTKIHSRFDVPPAESVEFVGESMTQQHFKDESDINNIIKRYERTGFLVDPLTPATRQPQYGDFTSAPDFMTAQNIIAQASQAFDLLPASLRKRFNNDPSEMLAFLDDPANREEGIKLGIIAEPVQTVSSSDPVAASAATSSSET